MFVLIKGAGDIASGIALRLKHAGFDVAMTERAQPLAVRRTVSFSQAVYDGKAQVEDVSAVLVDADPQNLIQRINEVFAHNQIAAFVDPDADILKYLPEAGNAPAAVIDAIMAKRNTGTGINDAPVVIGIGPGFTAGCDCHAVIETMRGHTLGRVITEGSAIPNTGIPGEIGGFSSERLLRCASDGIFTSLAEIGSYVKKGDTVALVNCTPNDDTPDSVASVDNNAVPGIPVYAGIDGIVRGLLPSGIHVTQGMKAGDIDPRCGRMHCFTVSDKALAVGGGALEAILRFGALIPSFRG
ncbi:MAG: selenium-dependent molybdenum cofactor biosynthesis protein YqeB [Treponema sp.]|nr:selenium-dependent molybdenum cofactor biosynthesis protein YqeB [Treponema sp.]